MMIRSFGLLVGILLAFCSFAAGGNPRLRKDLNSVLDAKEHDKTLLGRTLEANEDRILKLVRRVI